MKCNHDVAVVILNFNGKKYLEKFLPTLLSFTKCPIYIADNASTDDSVSFLESEYPNQISLIKIHKNLGFAGGYNYALSQIKTQYYALVNSDVEVTDNWLVPLIDFLESHEEVAAVQPKIKNFHSPSYFEYAGAAGGFIDNWGYPYCRGRIFNSLEKDEGQYDTIQNIDWTSGACMIIRASVFHQLEGFDSLFFAHMEEIDLCWRARAQGWLLYCVPQSTVYHVGGGTLNQESPKKTFLNFRNNLLLLYKNLPTFQLIRVLPLRLFLDGLAALMMLFNKSHYHFFSIIKAHFSFYFLLSKVKRSKKQLATRKSNILYQYFILKRKKFINVCQ